MTESVGLAALPPKVFAVVIELLAEASPGYLSGYEEDSLRRQNLVLQKQTLKDLSVVSEDIRKVAQPLLFQDATIPWSLDIAVPRARNLVRLLEARPESSAWFKTLHIRPEALALLGAPISLSISTLLSHLNGLQSLKLLSLSAVVVDSPPQLFASITDLEIVAIQDLVDLKNLILVLIRCRNLISLTCGFCAVASDIEFPETAIPNLARLTAPIALAKAIAPGRPIERLEISLSPDISPLSLTTDDLKLLASGAIPLRGLSFPLIQWSEGWFAAVAPLFPSLERLSVHVKWGQRVSSDDLNRPGIGSPSSSLLSGVAPEPSRQRCIALSSPPDHKNDGAASYRTSFRRRTESAAGDSPSSMESSAKLERGCLFGGRGMDSRPQGILDCRVQESPETCHVLDGYA